MSIRPIRGIPLSAWLSLAFAVFLGAGLGVALGGTVNIIRNENFTEFKSALPTKLYDIKGRLITEFFSEEKRNPVSIRELPPDLIGAFITLGTKPSSPPGSPSVHSAPASADNGEDWGRLHDQPSA